MSRPHDPPDGLYGEAQPTKSDTPETDAEAVKHRVYDYSINGYLDAEIVPASFARRLEVERDQARAEVARLKDRHRQSPEYLSMLESMLAVKAERDQLRAQEAKK